MSLQDKLDEFKAEFERMVPAGVVATMHRATADLIASGQADRALGLGGALPRFSLPAAGGGMVSSSELLARGPLVLTFYRGGWCPYCNLDLAAVEAIAEEIRHSGASLLAISPETPANGRKTQRDRGLSFPVLSDQGGMVADRLGLRFRLPVDLIEIYQGFGIDLPTVNGDPAWTLPMPARYVVGADGLVEYAEVSPDYSRLPEPSEVLPVLQRLRQKLPA